MSTVASEIGSSARAHSQSVTFFTAIVVVSAILVGATAAAYFFPGREISGHLLRQLSMGSENSVGAWWSGAILLLGALHCLDGAASATESAQSRRGWAALSAIMLALSFDEVSSLHEFIAGDSLKNLLPFGAVSVLFFVATIQQLVSGGTRRRTIFYILLGFSLFASVPLQEYVQHEVEWTSRFAYGIRAALEEGTEIAAAIILLGAIATNNRGPRVSLDQEIVLNRRFRSAALVITIVALPLVVAGSYVLPYPGGPADWLASAVFLLCAINTIRMMPPSFGNEQFPGAILLFTYVSASAMSSAIKLNYELNIFGQSFSVRAVFFSLLMIWLIPWLRRSGRNVPVATLGALSALLLVLGTWPDGDLLWRSTPPLVAILLYWIESRTAIDSSGQVPV